MRYVAYSVEGAANPRFRPEKSDLNEVADEIAAIYSSAAEQGGRVVAGHTLACDWLVRDRDGIEIESRIDYLFLVMELPGKTVDSETS